ncbi:MAG: response regulator [Nitrospirae bacterium]|nr:response regulator [Nitrospirota bacterium]
MSEFDRDEYFVKANARILVVEDSLTQAEQLKYILARAGYEVSVAKNGREALDIVGGINPAIIISDIIMPEMDGFTLCKYIKADQALKRLPLIFLTALSGPEDVLKALECGADNFITKPFDEKYLLTKVHHILVNEELRRESGKGKEQEIIFKGRRYSIASEPRQMLDLLLSTYETAVMKNRELREMQEKLETLNENLEKKVEERTADLRKEIAERWRVEEEVRRLNAELEQRVAKRTAQLEFAHKELEAFSYSISHDLRAPLRIINGFAQIVMKDHCAGLSEEAIRLLTAIGGQARHMDDLISALLSLSKLGRQAIKVSEIDMEKLVKGVFDELKGAVTEREVRFTAGPLPSVHGDPALIRQVLSNLIANALKFTRHRETAEIEVGGRREGNESVYYVKDNGVGFDMKYAGKLFGAFQRLHSSKEFEGTGIGLSIVQRIINLHGGRVWAEGERDRGATFYFTL